MCFDFGITGAPGSSGQVLVKCPSRGSGGVTRGILDGERWDEMLRIVGCSQPRVAGSKAGAYSATHVNRTDPDASAVKWILDLGP